MAYYVNFTKPHEQPFRICLSGGDLPKETLLKIQAHASSLFDCYKKNSTTRVSIQEISEKIQQLPEAQVAESCAVTVSKLRTESAVQPVFSEYWAILKKLVSKTQKFTLKWVLILFISPFLALFRYLRQGKKAPQKLQNIFESKASSQKSFTTHLKRVATFVQSRALNPEEAAPLLNGLKASIAIGKKVAHLMGGKGGSVQDLATELTQQIKPTAPLFLPVTLTIDNLPSPLLFIFTKDKESTLLEIVGLPQSGHSLAASYKIPLSNERSAIVAILNAFSAEHFKPQKGFSFSYREKVRLENVSLVLGDPFAKDLKTGTGGKGQEALLHEVLCNFATPLSSASVDEDQNKDFFFTLVEGFKKQFPGTGKIDKMEWLLACIEEQAATFFAVEKKLSEKDRIHFFKHLRVKIEGLERRLSKDPANRAHPLFQKFYERLKTLESQQEAIGALEKKHSNKTLAQNLSKKTTTSIRPVLPKALFQMEVVAKEKGAPPSCITTKDREAVQGLKKSLGSLDRVGVLESLKALHARIDQLIEGKEYTTAQELGLLTLGALPIKSASGGIWGLYKNPLEADQCSEMLTAVAKGVWESSLRLNITYLEPEQLIPLFKVQIAQYQIGKASRLIKSGWAFDYVEMENIIHLHPHIRFGWRPEHFAELSEIQDFIDDEKKFSSPLRLDGIIHLQSWKGEGLSIPPMQRTPHLSDGFLTDFARLQVMLTSLLKPDYCLTPFFASGKMDQAEGLLWLDGLQAKAVAQGAKSPQEIKEGVKLIRLKEVQERFKTFKRLELGKGEFVTESTVVTIIDAIEAGSKKKVAYLPTGYGLPPSIYNDKYGIKIDQNNTLPLPGKARGFERFIGTSDEMLLHKSTVDTLSEQSAFTEPSLLLDNLQIPPRGQINQIDNFILESLQMATSSSRIAPESVFEALGILFREQGLANPEVQRTVLLLLSRTFLVEKLFANPSFYKELHAAAENLRTLAISKSGDPSVFPFILQVGQILKEHAERFPEAKNIGATLPCFANLIKIGAIEQTGKKWLEGILNNQEKERTNAAVSYLFGLMRHFPEQCDSATISKGLFATHLLEANGDAHTLPMFSKMLQRWVRENLMAHAVARFEKDPAFLNDTLNGWIKAALPLNMQGTPTRWKVAQKHPFTAENGIYRILFPSLQLLSIASGKPVALQETIIPSYIQRSPLFLALFGNKNIRAEFSNTTTLNQSVYTFRYGAQEQLYRIVYHHSRGDVAIFSLLPNTHNKESSWFYHTSTFQNVGPSALEAAICHQGLWVSQKNPSEAYLITAPLASADRSHFYRVERDRKGGVKKVVSVDSGLKVAALTPVETEAVAPFAEGGQTLVLLSSKNRPQEIRCLGLNATLKQEKGGWTYHDPRLDKISKWSLEPAAGRFLSSLQRDYTQFLLPFESTQGGEFLLLPYQIHASPGEPLKFEKNTSPNNGQHLPITLSLDKDSTVTSSPSGFLYLAYYFGMKKDYERALFYLKKAKTTAALGDAEAAAFHKIAKFFEKIPHTSLNGLIFQLKAQLAIRKITQIQFSSTLYARENQGGFLANTDHIETLMRRYQKRKESSVNGITTPFRLSHQELFDLERIRQTSFNPIVNLQKAKDAQLKAERVGTPLPIDRDIFISTALNGAELSEIQPTTLIPALLLATSLNKPVPLQQLLRKGPVTGEHITRHFFHFYNSIVQKQEASSILSYLLATPLWELQPPQTEDEKKIASTAHSLRSVLIALACVVKKENSKTPLQPLDLKQLKKAKNALPFWGRNTWKPLRIAFNIFDIGFVGYLDINEIAKISEIPPDQKKALTLLASLVSILNTLNPLFMKIDRGFRESGLISALNAARENFTSLYETFVGQAVGTHPLGTLDPPLEEEGVSLATIQEYFQNPPENHTLLPLETTEIPKFLREEKSKSAAHFNQRREMRTYLRESEGELGFSILEFRGLSEEALKIQHLEKKLQEQLKTSTASPEPLKVDPKPLLQLQAALQKQIASFASPTPEDTRRKENGLKALDLKYAQACQYANPAQTEDPGLKEEYKQLLSGLHASYPVLKEEISRKMVFSPQEIHHFNAFLAEQLDSHRENSLATICSQKKTALLDSLRQDPSLPKTLRQMFDLPDLYTDFEILQAAEKMYKDPRYGQWFSTQELLEQRIFEYLLYLTAYQQLVKAAELLKTDASHADKALLLLQNGLLFDRYFGPSVNPMIARKCLVAEARSQTIYRPEQRTILNAFSTNPVRWSSLKMGDGKTSRIMPTCAQILAEQGKKVVLTVPEVLLKQNRRDLDPASRILFDQASLEFSIPLVQDLPLNYLAEKVAQVETVFLKKGYVITTVEELCTLHNTCILMQDALLNAVNNRDTLSEKEKRATAKIHLRLHYYKKLDGLLNGEGHHLNLETVYFGDEADETHDSTHEVSIAVGEKKDPSKELRTVSRTLLTLLLNQNENSPLGKLKKMLLENTYPVLTPKEVVSYMRELAKTLLTENTLFEEGVGTTLKKLDPDAWADYLVGLSEQLPPGLPNWQTEEGPLQRGQITIGIAKQLLSQGGTFASFLAQKTGNDLGLSDFEGFNVVPKITKNETRGKRFADKFDMTFAQYLGYLEFFSCQSLTTASLDFLREALSTFKEKSPLAYGALLSDYQSFIAKRKDTPELLTYLLTPEAYTHRWNILDDVIFDGGYIKEYSEQVRTNVQEIFHRKQAGGVTGTLDPYVLPFISEKVQLHTEENAGSTRKVEAETLLRMGLNLKEGLGEKVAVYQDATPLKAIDLILQDDHTVALVNGNGASSEGMDTLTWIGEMRTRSAATGKNFLFRHPQERIDYLWRHDAAKAIPFKGAIPPKTICIYAPSDVRGVDLKIPKGKVHVFVSSTQTLSQYAQKLYRARQIGTEHQIILHVPASLTSTIQEKTGKSYVTYGEISNYLIQRPIEAKLERNLSAQLLKVNLDLKTVVSSFLKEINPQYDQHSFWSMENFNKIGGEIAANACFFKELRSFYIQDKAIDFEQCYAPRKFISGEAKVVEEFDRLTDQVSYLIDKILKASIESAAILAESNKRSLPEIQQSLTQKCFSLLKGLENNLRYKGLYEQMAQELIGVLQNSDNPVAVFKGLANLHREILKTLHQENSDESPLRTQLQELETYLREIFYGPGRSHFYNTLRDLLDTIHKNKALFTSQLQEHAKHLPPKTSQNRIGNSGNNEQVKELQQVKEIDLEEEEDDTSKVSSKQGKPYRTYQAVSVNSLILNGQSEGVHPLSNEPPFNTFFISTEARDLLRTLPFFQGTPLVYLACDFSENNRLRLSLITPQDYQRGIRPNLEKPQCQNLSIYAFEGKGIRWMNGGSVAGTHQTPPMNQVLTLKAYLGYKEEFTPSNLQALIWKKSLTPGERQTLLSHSRAKGVPSQTTALQKLLDSH